MCAFASHRFSTAPVGSMMPAILPNSITSIGGTINVAPRLAAFAAASSTFATAT